MTQLARCPHCQRHLRLTETVCPFCEGSVAGRLTPKQTKPLQTRGLSRAGILALGASLAAAGALEGCAEESDPEPEDEGSQVPIYGAPVQNDGSVPPVTSPDAGVEDAGTSNDAAASDSGTVMAIYGAPVQPKDSGVVAVPVYGAPIQPDAGNPDAGPADAGRLVPVYGAPFPVYGAPLQPSTKAEED